MVVHDLAALLLDVRRKGRVAVQAVLLSGGGHVLPTRGVIGSSAHAERHLEILRHASRAMSLKHGHDILEHVVGFVHEHLDKALIGRAGRVTGNLTHDALPVHMHAHISVEPGIDGSKPVLRARIDVVGLKDHEVNTVVSSERGGSQTTVAGTGDDEVGVIGLNDLGRIDIGSRTQPAGNLLSGGLVGRGNSRERSGASHGGRSRKACRPEERAAADVLGFHVSFFHRDGSWGLGIEARPTSVMRDKSNTRDARTERHDANWGVCPAPSGRPTSHPNGGVTTYCLVKRHNSRMRPYMKARL